MSGAVTLRLYAGEEEAAAELIAAAVLIRTAVWLFRDTETVEQPLFLPAAAALVTAVIGGVLLALAAGVLWRKKRYAA